MGDHREARRSTSAHYVVRVGYTVKTVYSTAGAADNDWITAKREAIKLSLSSGRVHSVWHIGPNGGGGVCGVAEDGNWR